MTSLCLLASLPLEVNSVPLPKPSVQSRIALPASPLSAACPRLHSLPLAASPLLVEKLLLLPSEFQRLLMTSLCLLASLPLGAHSAPLPVPAWPHPLLLMPLPQQVQ